MTNLLIVRMLSIMLRPLRIEYEGAYYHVMNRGRARQTAALTTKQTGCLQKNTSRKVAMTLSQ